MPFQIDLSGKTALVTGVTDGIGAGVAARLAEAGCKVVGCGRRACDTPEALAFEESVAASGSEALYVQTDVCHRAQIEALVANTIECFGRLDIVVSNAGTAIFKGTADCSEEDWSGNLDLNFNAHWRLGQLTYPYLKASGSGVFLIMGSNHGFSTIPGCSPYSITKAGLLGMVQSMAIEWGPEIRVLGLAPGFIDTKQNQNWFASFPDANAERQQTVDRHPAKRLGTPKEIGAFCVFLSSEHAAFATGTTYLIDGGRSALMQDA